MPIRRRANHPLILSACAASALALALLGGCVRQRPVATTTPPPPAPALPAPAVSPLTALARQADGLDPAVLELALKAQDCALTRRLAPRPQRLAVIDYSLPSTQPRLWVFDLRQSRLLYAEHVAHGKNSGENLSTRFSNVEGSLQSSLGLFTTAETYDGENGYSLRMDGLEPGVNDRARERLLVMHGADYVNPLQALRQGRLGRSWGCPAVRREVARPLIDSLKQGQLLFAYYPDRDWLQHSSLLRCAAASASSQHSG